MWPEIMLQVALPPNHCNSRWLKPSRTHWTSKGIKAKPCLDRPRETSLKLLFERYLPQRKKLFFEVSMRRSHLYVAKKKCGKYENLPFDWIKITFTFRLFLLVFHMHRVKQCCIIWLQMSTCQIVGESDGLRRPSLICLEL